MNSVASISLSAMHAAGTGLAASAHNIANAQTQGFRRQTTLREAAPDGGVTTSLRAAAEPGPAMEADLVQQLVDKNAFLANLAVFRTGDAMLGALLDTAG